MDDKLKIVYVSDKNLSLLIGLFYVPACLFSLCILGCVVSRIISSCKKNPAPPKGKKSSTNSIGKKQEEATKREQALNFIGKHMTPMSQQQSNSFLSLSTEFSKELRKTYDNDMEAGQGMHSPI